MSFTAFATGSLLFYRALPIMLVAPFVAGLVGSGRLDARLVIGLGFLLSGVGSLLQVGQTTPGSDFWNLAPTLLTAGLGGSMLFIPLLITVQSTVSELEAPQASAFITLAFQLGGSIAGALAVVLVDQRSSFHLDHLAATAALSHPPIRTFLRQHSTGSLSSIIFAQAQTLAFADEAWLLGLLAFVLIPIAFAMPRQPHDLRGGAELG